MSELESSLKAKIANLQEQKIRRQYDNTMGVAGEAFEMKTPREPNMELSGRNRGRGVAPRATTLYNLLSDFTLTMWVDPLLPTLPRPPPANGPSGAFARRGRCSGPRARAAAAVAAHLEAHLNANREAGSSLGRGRGGGEAD